MMYSFTVGLHRRRQSKKTLFQGIGGCLLVGLLGPEVCLQQWHSQLFGNKQNLKFQGFLIVPGKVYQELEDLNQIWQNFRIKEDKGNGVQQEAVWKWISRAKFRRWHLPRPLLQCRSLPWALQLDIKWSFLTNSSTSLEIFFVGKVHITENSHFSHLKCIIKWILVHSWCCTTIIGI